MNLGKDLTDNFSLLYRLSLDNYDQRNTRYINKGGPRQPDGEFTTVNTTNFLSDQILNLNYNFQLNSRFSLDGIVGFNSRREVKRVLVTVSENQFIYGLFTHQNFIEHQNFSFLQEENTMGVYVTTTLDYSKYVYLNLQARNDWTSTLEKANRSVLYPSASLSFLASDAIDAIGSSGLVDLLKLRVGYGTSAGYPDPYRTRNFLGSSTNDFVTTDGTILNTNTVSNLLGNRELKHELITELEFGMEGRFINNRLGVDLSLYNKQSDDLIVDLPLIHPQAICLQRLMRQMLRTRALNWASIFPFRCRNPSTGRSGIILPETLVKLTKCSKALTGCRSQRGNSKGLLLLPELII